MAAAAMASSMLSDDSERPQTISSSVPSISECSHRGGFTGMFKVPSLVFDIELEDNGIGGHWQEEDWEEDEVVSEIQRFVQPTTAAEARLLSDVKVACPHAKDGQDTARLVSILTALGYRCSLRTALGGGEGPDCLRNLRHTFIMCESPTSPNPNQPQGPGRRYIIDPQFKEQFIIAKTTARYAAILAAIPQVFVGPEEHLSLLVNFLCSEMSSAFRQLGSVLPPWRQASSMLSKWKPRKSVDESLLGAAAAAAASAAGGMAGATGAGASRCCGGGEAAAAGAASGGGGPAAFASMGPGPHPFTVAQQQQQQQLPQWLGLGSCKRQGPPPPQQQQHHWQQAAQEMENGVRPPTAAAGAPPPLGGGGGGGGMRRPSYEPQRVVFGGNFVPITPSPALAL